MGNICGKPNKKDEMMSRKDWADDVRRLKADPKSTAAYSEVENMLGPNSSRVKDYNERKLKYEIK